MIYIFIIIIFILIIILTKIKITEHYGYNQWQFALNSNNFDQPFKNLTTGYNHPYPEDLPIPSANDKNFPQFILEIVNETNIWKILNKLLSPKINAKWIYYKIRVDDLFNLNKETWHDRLLDFNIYNEDNLSKDHYNFTIPKSPIKQINQILKLFLERYNEESKKINGDTYFESFIYKYKIHSLQYSEKGSNTVSKKFGIILVLVNNNTYVGITIYLESIINDSIKFTYFDIIGYYNTQDLMIPKGKDDLNNNNYYEMNPTFRNDGEQINYYNYERKWVDQLQYNLNNTMKYHEVCFNTEFDRYPDTILNYVYNRENCENEYDNFGRRKPKGIMDRPCLEDTECPFFNGKLGGCDKLSGYCQMPKGIRNLGFHNYRKEDQPLCYNCNNKKYEKITNLGMCCEEQKDIKKYPYLEGIPDYAYPNDENIRLKNDT